MLGGQGKEKHSEKAQQPIISAALSLGDYTKLIQTIAGPVFPSAGTLKHGGSSSSSLRAKVKITVEIKERISPSRAGKRAERRQMRSVTCVTHSSSLVKWKRWELDWCIWRTERFASDSYSWNFYPFQFLLIYFFFCISFILYSVWTVHYTNVQGKNTAFTLYIFLKYIQSTISYWHFHNELQPVCTLHLVCAF